MKNLTQHIFLIGFMGTGKSSVSRFLSMETDLARIGLDQKIEEVNNMSISEIFSCFGEGYFRESETKVLEMVCHNEPSIIDCGGGLPTREINRKIMKAHGKCIWFTAKPETIHERLKGDETRPLLQGCMTAEYIGEMMKKREAAYKAAADIIVETDGKTPEEICREIIGKVE